MKLARTIRFDASDEHVFAHAADEGEWAISGSFPLPASRMNS